jgi:hypothetical protein
LISTRNAGLLSGAVLVTLALTNAAPVHAQVVFTLGNNPQADEENILLNNGQVGVTVTGTTQNSGLLVQFASTTDILVAPSNGQARVESQDGAINDITISIPGGTFTDLIINPFIGGDNAPPNGTLDVTIDSSFGVQNFNYAISNGSNFATLLADPGTTINFVTLSSRTGFSDLRQPRISGASDGTVPSAVPEPGALGLLVGAGVTGSIFAVRRLRRR